MRASKYWLPAAWIVVTASGALSCLSACGTSQSSEGKNTPEKNAGGDSAQGLAGANSENAQAGDAAAAGGAGTVQGTASGGSEGGADSSGQSGRGSEAGSAGEGASPANPAAFTGPDPFPCATDGDTKPPSFAAQCDPASGWKDAARVACDAAPGASLIGVTPDELTMAWSEPERSMARYYVADRASPHDAFASPVRVLVGNVVALSPDGLRLVALSGDHSELLVISRADRASEFGAESEGEFSELNADAKTQGYGFSSCVFAPDDRSIYYTAGAADERYPLRFSTRGDDGAWPVGTALEACEFEAHAGYGRYPTGVSADGKTLFFYDSWRGKARAAFRKSSTGSFTWFRDLGELFVPQPNSACDRLYYSVADPDASIVSAARD